MKKARLLFLASLVVMAIAAFKEYPQGENVEPRIAQPPAAATMTDTTTRY